MKVWRTIAEQDKEIDGKHEVKLMILFLVSFPVAVGLVVFVLYAVQEGWIN